MSNFEFLKNEYPELAKLAQLAENYYAFDPASSIGKLRTFCEFVVKDIYTQQTTIPLGISFKDLISECRNEEFIPGKILNLIDIIRIKGNLAIHEQKGSKEEALQALKDVYFIAYWYYILKTDKKPNFIPFKEPVNTDKKIIDEQKQLIEKLQKQLEAQQQKQQITSEKLIKFKKRSADISNNKQFNFTEKQTRQKLIDLKLNKQGWEIVDFKDDLNLMNLNNVAVRELPTKEGFADYALFVKGQLLGIIEAKKISVGSKNVIEQAKRYSKDVIQGSGIWREYKVPFLYATNGETIHFLDIRNETNIQREILEFHNAVALDEKFQQEKINFKTWLDKNPIESYYNSDKQLYPFQQKAINAAENAILDQKREMMLAMATGTGKTFTILSLIYRLLEAKVIKRVLFLVDRKALAAQAITAFSSFSTPHGSKFDKEYEVYSQKFQKEDFEDGATFNPNVLPNEYLTNPQPNHSFVYVSTIQRMTINLQGKYSNISEDDMNEEYEIDAEKLNIPIHAFDLIVVDECHRGYTSKESNIWRDTIKHFDGIKIGLTATPAQHTVAYFNEPIFKYSVEEAVDDGFLVDYDDPIIINSGVKINGVFLKEGEQIELVDVKTGKTRIDYLEDERNFDATDVEKKITVPDCNVKVIRELKKYIEEHVEKTGRFPKTLIFASNDLPNRSHADEIVEICKKEFNQGDDFVCKITGSPTVDRPLQKIKTFRNRPEPKIVVTVDMLSTGVDVPSIEFIVFLRPVKSRILWEQMLGRGTRLCSDINKDHFTIVDCFNGTLINYFKNVSGFDYKMQKETVPISEVIEKIYNGEDKDYNIKVLTRRLRRIQKNMSGKAYELFSKFIEKGNIGKFADELKNNIENDFIDTMNILRNEEFQNLLVNYPRNDKSFIRAVDYVDEVTSGRVNRYDGTSTTTKDYLNEFCEFVKNNKEQVEAIKLLFDSPKDWNTSALKEINDLLKQNDFKVETLQKIYGSVYHKSLVDIISMIKHAVKEDEELLTSEERVTRAINKLKEEINFSPDQEKWLELIKNHLIENLTIDKDDFELLPVFTRKGGISVAKRIFNGIFDTIISRLNELIAA